LSKINKIKLFILFARARFSPYSAPDNSSTYEISLKYFIVFSSFRIEGGKKYWYVVHVLVSWHALCSYVSQFSGKDCAPSARL